jgi:hypothetical protein
MSSEPPKEIMQGIQPPKEPIDTMTIHVTVHHSVHGEQPVGFQYARSFPLENRGEAYVRKLQIGEEWESLDFGWVKNPGIIVIENKAGRGRLTHPTAEEITTTKAMILLLGVEYEKGSVLVPMFRIGPDKPCLIEFDELPLVVRSKAGIIPITLSVFPR